jgi:probable rRNA maturation factor
VQAARVRAEAGRLLRMLGIDAELSVALVGDAEIQVLNARYRGKDLPTDVLAFPVDVPTNAPSTAPVARLLWPGCTRSPRPALMGDVVISLDTAARQAAQRNISIADEVRVLLVHGVLHLLGHDHERSPAEARRMFSRQRRLVARLGATPEPARLDSWF